MARDIEYTEMAESNVERGNRMEQTLANVHEMRKRRCEDEREMDSRK